jgi:glycerol-3-phosphate dehydrogenase (NAD(P)+)
MNWHHSMVSSSVNDQSRRQNLPFAVFGAGAFGTAIAMVLSQAGRDVTLVARDQTTAETLQRARENKSYLSGISFPEGLKISAQLPLAKTVLWAVPAQALKSTLQTHIDALGHADKVVICAKGLDAGSDRRLSEIAEPLLERSRIAVLSGPAFAVDLARGSPTAVTVAAYENALELCQALSTERLRCYASDDLVGVELGGALKNVLAIAAGAVIGAGFGESARAALVTRGFAELCRIAELAGARPETLMGLSGLGDLMLTTASAQSRNTAYGMALGAGDALPEKLAEGAKTAASALVMARSLGVEAPVIEKTVALLDGKTTVQNAVSDLLSREIKTEL